VFEKHGVLQIQSNVGNVVSQETRLSCCANGKRGPPAIAVANL